MVKIIKEAKLRPSVALRCDTTAKIVQFVADDKHGKIIGCDAFGPPASSDQPRSSGTASTVEILYTILGRAARRCSV
jgi:hypothetical protein